MLVMSNNFMQLFFGLGSGGVVSYLLIGFWYTRPTANFANLKAFLPTASRFASCSYRRRGPNTPGRSTMQRFSRMPTRSRRADSTSQHRVWPRSPLPASVCRRRHGKSAQMPLTCGCPIPWKARPDLGVDPCRDHGDGRHFHGGAHVAAVRIVGNGPLDVYRIGATTAISSWIARNRAQRHQTGRRLFDLSQLGYMTVALGASATGGHFSPHERMVFQASLFLGVSSVDHRHASRTGHCARWAA